MALIVPNAIDTTGGNRFEALDQAEPDAVDFEIAGNIGRSGVGAGCTVTTNNSAANVSVSGGVVVINGSAYTVSGTGTLALPAPPADSRFDMVVARVIGGVASLVVVSGENSSTNPTFPRSRNVLNIAYNPNAHIDFDTDVVLAAIYRSGSATVTAARIVDKRVMLVTSITNQGSSAPTSSVGTATGELFYRSISPSGTSSGVWVKTPSGDWLELAANVGSHLPIGSMVAWPSVQAIPNGCVEANGQGLSTDTYSDLFAIYQYTHGGSGSTFNVPNMNNRVPRGTTSTANVGQATGSDTVTLAENQLPAHTHTIAHTHTLVHTHTINHDHAAVTSSSAGSHSHSIAHTHIVIPAPAGSLPVMPLDRTAAGGDNHIHGNGLSGSGFVMTGTGGSPSWTLYANGGLAGTPINFSRKDATNTASDPHVHNAYLTPESGNSSTVAAHTHSVDLPNFTGTSGPASATTTSAASNANSGATGAGASITITPASRFVRWIIRAFDPTPIGPSIGSITAAEVSIADVADYYIGTNVEEALAEAGTGEYRVNVQADTGAAYEIPAGYTAHRLTMTQNCDFTFAAPAKAGQTVQVYLSGNFVPGWPVNVVWSGGAAPTYEDDSLIVFTTFDGGTTWVGALVGTQFA
jgi:microcystin-dependent protein